MSHGAHRKPRTRPAASRLRRIAAGISLAAAAVTGAALTDNLVASPQGDTTWGAPDTPDDTTWGTTAAPASTPDTAPQDTTW